MNTPGSNIKSGSIYGGRHLKRVPITIQYKNKPEMVVSGYALTHEILPEQVSFFAAQKFPVDEELVVTYSLNGGEPQTAQVTLRSIHEQISSGRVMNALPTEENPFPARKFYRCYSFASEAAAQNAPQEEVPSEQPQVAEEVPAAESANSEVNVSEENKAA